MKKKSKQITSEWEKEREIAKKVCELFGKIKFLYNLNPLYLKWEERMKEIAFATLKVGTQEVIEEWDGGLSALDYIWDLQGDYSWSGKQTTPYRSKAVEYFLGRKVNHIWGTGIIARMKDKGFGIRVRIRCGTCKSNKMTIWLP